MAKAVKKKTTKSKNIRRDIIKQAEQVKNIPANHQKNFTAFMTYFFHGETLENIEETGCYDCFSLANTLWKELQKRQENDIFVQVFNPTEKTHNWTSDHTVIEIIQKDTPFIVDSVLEALRSEDYNIHRMFHPIIRTLRDDNGTLVSVHPFQDTAPGLVAESIIHLQIDKIHDKVELKRIEKLLNQVLKDVWAAVQDWRPMEGRLADTISSLSTTNIKGVAQEKSDDTVRFLNFLKAGNFTFLGYREYTIKNTKGKPHFTPIKKAGLGILRDDKFLLFDGIRNAKNLPKDVYKHLNDKSPLVIVKANQRSRVHRPVYIDVIGIKNYDSKGNVIGIRLFAGLFTSECYAQATTYVPYLDKKVETVLKKSRFDPDTHLGKTMRHILETYPRDELFQISIPDLQRISRGIMELRRKPTVDIFIRNDTLHRFFSCMVYVPREDFDTGLRLKFTKILEEELHGKCIDYYIQIDQNSLARVQYIIKTEGYLLPKYDREKIQKRLYETSRSWDNRLMDIATQWYGEEDALNLLTPLQGGFSAAYKEEMPLRSAVRDIEWINLALAGEELQAKLYQNGDEEKGHAHFKIYKKGSAASLSNILPIMRNMGFQIITEHPYDIEPADGSDPIWVHKFYGKIELGADQTIKGVRFNFEEAFIKAYRSEIDQDRFNSLILQAGITPREANMLRAYAKFLRQANYPHRNSTMANVLGKHSKITQKLCALFEIKFNPLHKKEEARAKAAGLLLEIDHMLSKVDSVAEDTIIRSYMTLMRETLRTNYYQVTEDGGPYDYLTFKFASKNIADIPAPKPVKEIFVYSTRFEAVHLRGGDIARGGIRWSDRYDDFRTEILGLIKAQIVKNSVIIPVGSKGGFICKNLNSISDPQKRFEEAKSCYRQMMRGLLGLTDNIVKGKIVHPENTVRWDDDDPYLVVAADKGTATFSDIANGISKEFNFWLDDAFASGGSKGYDHKAMGITARGAWESVKRHFRELGKDIQKEEFTVVGVGDMSGDVFGNGMLLSKKIKLIAAFDHRNIFVDPDPDPEVSFKERQRLFKMDRSSWEDYDTKKLSKGGRIFSRNDKTLKLTKEIQKRLDIESATITPTELMRKLLLEDAELLWFGGIGTYVKSSNQSNDQVGDKSNDSIRVNGDDLRCKVIGEGANLGMTQAGRIEFSIKGGKCNTDFIDNSAGVDTSDHEVNLKIMLNQMVASKKLSMKQRDSLLEKMEDEVGEHVLKNNYDQSLVLTMTHSEGKERLNRHASLIRDLERAGFFDRRIEDLPEDDTLQDMATRGGQLTRPEISVILSYSKIQLFNQLLESNLPDEQLMQSQLIEYFPKLAQQKFKKEILKHKLKREIIATEVANVVINRMGPAFVKTTIGRTGGSPADISRGFLLARECFDLRNTWDEIDQLDNKISADQQLDMYMACSKVISQSVKWFLGHYKAPLSLDKLAPIYKKGIEALSKEFAQITPPSIRDPIEERFNALKESDAISNKLAKTIASLPTMATALDIIYIADKEKKSLQQVGRLYFAVSDRFKFNDLIQAAQDIPSEGHWAKEAQNGLVDDLYGALSIITAKLVKKNKAGGKDASDILDNWVEQNTSEVKQLDSILKDIDRLGTIDIHILTLMTQKLRLLAKA